MWIHNSYRSRFKLKLQKFFQWQPCTFVNDFCSLTNRTIWIEFTLLIWLILQYMSAWFWFIEHLDSMWSWKYFLACMLFACQLWPYSVFAQVLSYNRRWKNYFFRFVELLVCIQIYGNCRHWFARYYIRWRTIWISGVVLMRFSSFFHATFAVSVKSFSFFRVRRHHDACFLITYAIAIAILIIVILNWHIINISCQLPRVLCDTRRRLKFSDSRFSNVRLLH